MDDELMSSARHGRDAAPSMVTNDIFDSQRTKMYMGQTGRTAK